MISVIIPVYNSEKSLDKCLQSIINQTYKELEIIVINNGSSDKSENIINKYAEKDSRINKINTTEKGVSIARNIGIRYAKGEWVLFIDSDDYIEKNMLYEMLKLAEKNKVFLVKCGYQLELENVKNKKIFYASGNVKINNDFWLDFFTSYKYNQVWGQLISSDIAKKVLFDESLAMAEDYKYNYQLYKKIKNIFIINKSFYHYIINKNGINYSVEQKKLLKKISDIIDVCEFIWQDEKKYRNIIEERLIKESCSHIINYLANFNNIMLLDEKLSKEFYKMSLNHINISNIGKYKLIVFFLKKKNYKILRIISIIYTKLKVLFKFKI